MSAADPAAAPAARVRVLCVDDEPKVLQGLSMVLRRPFDVVLAQDITLANGVLIVPRGHEVTAALIERLRGLRPGACREPVRVVIPGAPDAHSSAACGSGRSP